MNTDTEERFLDLRSSWTLEDFTFITYCFFCLSSAGWDEYSSSTQLKPCTVVLDLHVCTEIRREILIKATCKQYN